MIMKMLASLVGSGGGTKEFGGISIFNATKFAGVDVTVSTAMQHACVFACVRDKAESIAQLPVKMLISDPKTGKNTRKFSGREHKIFTQQPNDFQSMQDFAEMAVAWLELRGNFYAYVNRNRYDNTSEIIPFFNQDGVNVSEDRGRVYYTYVTNDGKGGMIRDFIDSSDIMHIKLFSTNGYKGISPIANNGRALGVSMAQEDFLGSLMESGAMPQGVLSTDNIFKDLSVAERLSAQWEKRFGGSKNAGKTPVLENGLKYQALSISPADSELIAQRRYSREELCAIFKQPYTRLYPAEKGGTQNVEQDNIRYLTTALMPLIKKIEDAVSKEMPANHSIKFDIHQFLRGDIKTMSEVAGGTFKLGAINMNELRGALGWEEIEHGEYHAIDTNNLTFGSLADIPRLQEEQRQLAMQPQTTSPANNEAEEPKDNQDGN
ncbi:portal protein [Vibrio phage 1254]|nr:putative portal protein [Vibrio phage 11E33.1]QZI86760.1 putative portal protein [Vibrio phage 82E32.1]QZI92593.1 putative portal protein [Vibrio phage 19E33.1]QZI92796.1 putative portal protein [Vibrio phage 38E33.6a]QZI92984.1 putative portal protein [Vibrio phage 82E32.2]QZI93059.1 putative portal protein [Vibrio phage 82E32.3]QZI93106.1 putative portal protein [Vibrio phage 82E33.2]